MSALPKKAKGKKPKKMSLEQFNIKVDKKIENDNKKEEEELWENLKQECIADTNRLAAEILKEYGGGDAKDPLRCVLDRAAYAIDDFDAVCGHLGVSPVETREAKHTSAEAFATTLTDWCATLKRCIGGSATVRRANAGHISDIAMEFEALWPYEFLTAAETDMAVLEKKYDEFVNLAHEIAKVLLAI